MNVYDLMPYLGGVVPGMKSPGTLNMNPSALLVGGMIPGILNQSTGGNGNLSTTGLTQIPGILNLLDTGANGANNNIGGDNYNLMKVLMGNYFGNYA